jgi:ion channel
MFEHRKSPLLPDSAFLRRMARSLLLGSGVLAVALGIGMIGYHFLEHLSWLDAFLNAAMILSGMGPITPLQTSAGKLFAGCYALFCGLVFITVVGILFAPIAHRLLHKFHLESGERKKS